MDTNLPDTSPAAVGRRLGLVRKARGWTKATMARRLDMSPQRWGLYEGGSRQLPHEIIAKFWRLTGATSDYILFERFDGLPYELAQKLIELEAGGPEEKRA